MDGEQIVKNKDLAADFLESWKRRARDKNSKFAFFFSSCSSSAAIALPPPLVVQGYLDRLHNSRHNTCKY
jgi:hypothetical protein